MMRLIRDCFCVFFLFLNASGWEVGRLYSYSFSNGLRGTSHYNKKFDDATDLAFGVFQFKWDSPHLLTGKLIQKSKKDYTQKYPFVIPKDSFQAVFKNGLVSDLKVSPNITEWDVEFIRAVLSAFQISDQIKEKNTFSIVEESVVGKCEAHYEVQSKNDSGSSEISAIIKTKNLTNCEKIPVFKTGVYGKNYDVLLKKRDFIDRTSVTYYSLNKNGVEEMRVRETIKIKSEKRFVTFINALALTNGTSIHLDDDPFEENFETDGLVSVGGLMYRNDFCNRNRENKCETDHYMNPKKFRTSYIGSEVKVVKELVQRIVNDLQDTSMIEAADTLDRFAILTGAIRQLNLGQLEEASASWEGDSQETFVFQNAVIFSGTLESLHMIRNLEKRDQLVAKNPTRVLPQLVQHLSLEYLDTFFEFATDPEVINKDTFFAKDLILEFTNLLRRYQTEEDKPFEEEQLKRRISEKYRPYISEKLQESYDRRDKWEFQVYVRAAGNMADLDIFSHYLLLELPPFQRTHLVNTMDRCVEIHPEKSRVILLKVYENSNETSSVRTAAVFQLFKTKPTQEEVLKIIQLAKDSNDVHIQNAVKTTVLSKNYDYRFNDEINKMVQSIDICWNKRIKRKHRSDKIFSGQKGTLPSENLAIPLIKKFFSEHVFRNGSSYNPYWSSLIEVFRATGADPTSVFLTKTNDEKGFKTSTKVGGMLDYFGIFEQNNEIQKKGSSNLEIDFDFGQIFIPLENFRPSYIYLLEFLFKLESVKEFILHMHEISVGFPTETGFPFLFSFQSPKVFSYQDKVYWDDIRTDVKLLYSDRKQVRMGIVNPLNGKYYLYGVDINKLISLPYVVSYKYYENQEFPYHMILQPLFKDKEHRILHLSTWEYLVARDFFPIEPITGIKYNNSLVSERVFVSRTHSDESGRLRAVLVSPSPSGLNLHEFVKGEELKAYFTTGPFGAVKLVPNSFDLYFKEDENHDTSLILKNKDPTYENFTRPSVENSEGITYEFKVGAEITGRTNRLVRLDYRAEENDRKEIINVSLQGSYSENDIKASESSFHTSIQRGEGSSDDPRCSSKNYTIGVISELKFGEIGGTVSYVSVKFDIHPRDYFANFHQDLNVTIDHDRLPKKYHEKVCNFKGGDYNFIGVDYHLDVTEKNSDKCQK